jgi:hypothetical protein
MSAGDADSARIAELQRHIGVLEGLTEYNGDGTDEVARLRDDVAALHNRMADGFNQMATAYAALVKALPGMIAAGVAAGLRPEPPKPPATVVRLTPRPKPPDKGSTP